VFLRKMQLTSENVLSTYCSPAVSIIIFTQKEALQCRMAWMLLTQSKHKLSSLSLAIVTIVN